MAESLDSQKPILPSGGFEKLASEIGEHPALRGISGKTRDPFSDEGVSEVRKMAGEYEPPGKREILARMAIMDKARKEIEVTLIGSTLSQEGMAAIKMGEFLEEVAARGEKAEILQADMAQAIAAAGMDPQELRDMPLETFLLRLQERIESLYRNLSPSGK